MKLTAEQLQDILMALHFGLAASVWEGVTDRPWWELPDEEKVAVLATVRSAHEELIRDRNLDPRTMEFQLQFLERINLASVQEEERREAERREMYLGGSGTKRIPLSGWREAINDLLSQSHFFSKFQKLAVERRLARMNLPSLAILSAMLRKKHEKILKRAKIRNEEEYYLVQEILASVDFPIDEESRQQLTTIAGDFESRFKG